uniref:Charged multivesicular body protein 6 n=1 Tax=Rhabditophanes sp. KR3021 TaxID=114890 RepID=A0AC35TLC5_9BILA
MLEFVKHQKIVKKLFLSKEKTINPSDMIQKLDMAEKMLLRKEDEMESQIEKEKEIALKFGSTVTRKSIRAISAIKNIEKLLEDIDNALSALRDLGQSFRKMKLKEEMNAILGDLTRFLPDDNKEFNLNDSRTLESKVIEQTANVTKILSMNDDSVSYSNITEEELVKDLQHLQAEADKKECTEQQDVTIVNITEMDQEKALKENTYTLNSNLDKEDGDVVDENIFDDSEIKEKCPTRKSGKKNKKNKY